MAGVGDVLSKVGSKIAPLLGPAGIIGEGALGAVQLFSNLNKARKDKAELEAIQDPFYKIQDEYNQNRNLSAIEAGGGLPAAQQDFYTSESQRGLSAGISGTLQSGGNANDIAKIFDVYNRGIDKTAAESADQHIKNIEYFKAANKDLAGQKTTQWAINQYQPTQAKRKQLSANINAEEQNAYGGANTLLGSVSALGTQFENADLSKIMKNLFSPKAGSNGVAPDSSPFQITGEPVQNLPPGYSNPPLENTVAAGSGGLTDDDLASFKNFLNFKKI